jgi:hypothetical protein
MSAYIKNTKRSQFNDLMLQLKLVEKQEQAKVNKSKRRKIKKIGDKINETETKTTLQGINETKSWLFEKIARLTSPCKI